MEPLILGSCDASALPAGIVATDVRHAVRAPAYASLCGAAVVFVFLDTVFPGADPHAAICPRCTELATGVVAPC